MTAADFITAIRKAQSNGENGLHATLVEPFRGCRNVFIDVSGMANGNKHDLWIRSKSGSKIVGRAYLGSRKMPVNLEGWPERIATIECAA